MIYNIRHLTAYSYDRTVASARLVLRVTPRDEPGLTTIRQDARAEGEQAVDLLLARLDGEEGPARSIVLSTELIERGSGEIETA